MDKNGLNTRREVGKFDEVAKDYIRLHDKSVAASGESPEYFARHKIACLRRLGFGGAERVVDFGCGIGNLTRLLATGWGQVTGYDPSEESIALARTKGGDAEYTTREEELEADGYDLAVLSGVLHHVPVAERVATMTRVRGVLRPGGTAVVFEHNPVNPLTRRAVDACPFDDDAILLPAREVRTTLSGAGFYRVRQHFVVFFPHQLRWLRPLEPVLSRCPLGAQTMTWAVKR